MVHRQFSVLSATILSVCLLITAVNGTYGPVPCPDLTLPPDYSSPGGDCTAPCQRETCEALASFFKSTYNATTPHLTSWRNKKGWEAVLQQNCSEILATPAADGSPSYCSWPGVTCCDSASQLSFGCKHLHALTALQLNVNGLNGSVSDPTFQQSIAQLHACGLTTLELQGNALSGVLDDSWGLLTNLQTLILGKVTVGVQQQRACIITL